MQIKGEKKQINYKPSEWWLVLLVIIIIRYQSNNITSIRQDLEPSMRLVYWPTS